MYCASIIEIYTKTDKHERRVSISSTLPRKSPEKESTFYQDDFSIFRLNGKVLPKGTKNITEEVNGIRSKASKKVHK